MVFLENFRIALAALRANLMRSILTTLGIIIGVAAVIGVVSIVQGLQYTITQQLQGVGATFIAVSPKQDRGNFPGVAARQVKLTSEDAQAIEEKVPGVKMMAPSIIGRATVKHKDRKHNPFLVLGVTDKYQDVANQGVDRGRFFSQVDLDNHRKVVVIGPKIAEELDLGGDPLGKEIYIDIYPATVIGVMEKKGQNLGMDWDDIVYVPFSAAANLFGRNAAERVELRLQAENAESVEQVKDGISRLLRQRHKIPADEPDDFKIQTQDEILDSVNKILGSVTAVVGGVVGIALLVGGIGIMNIMLATVLERTREIGVRRAVGARSTDIRFQFIVESFAISLIGGLAGIVVGLALARGVAAFAGWQTIVTSASILLSTGVAMVVGLASGIYPATRAAALDPIEALRYE
ncbi:MAG: ABC transporter permease [Thermoanaerobaculia bacterium]